MKEERINIYESFMYVCMGNLSYVGERVKKVYFCFFENL